MTQPPHSEYFADFWDRNPHLSTDPEFWMAFAGRPPRGGQIVSVPLPQLERAVIPPVALDDLIARWLALEAEELAESPESSYYNAMLARPRGGAGAVVGRVANVAIRTRQAAGDMFRPTR